MEKDITTQLKNRLIAEKEDLEKHLAKFTDKDPNIKGNFKTKFPKYETDGETDAEDYEESALEVQDYVDAIGVENILELRLAAVERALQRIAHGTYGKCTNCKAEQSVEQLKVNPAAERCQDCGKLI